MPFDPISGYKSAADIMSKFNISDPYEEERKSRSELNTYRQKKDIDAQYDREQQNALMLAIQAQSGVPGGMTLKQYTSGGATWANPQYSDEMNDQRVQSAIGKKTAMGAGAESGKMALAEESIQGIRDARNLLFPEGTPESFKRNTAIKSNFFGKAVPLSYEGQTINRRLGEALSAKLLIKTGVAESPGQAQALADRFLSGAFSDPRSALEALQELETFYGTYLGNVDPSGMFHQQGTEITQPATSGQPPTASSSLRQEAQQAISRGADPNKVAERFFQQTGESL